jgi:hypothetical protein
MWHDLSLYAVIASLYLKLSAQLIIAHFLADYPLQGEFLAKFKSPLVYTQMVRDNIQPRFHWFWILSAHCAIQAGGVLYVTNSLILAIIDYNVHFYVDLAKCRGRITFNQDQTYHIITRLIIAAVHMTAIATLGEGLR